MVNMTQMLDKAHLRVFDINNPYVTTEEDGCKAIMESRREAAFSCQQNPPIATNIS
jgi:hypothetical protein